MTIIVEDGTGKNNANSYASIAEIDTYFANHLYASNWNDATTSNKESAAIMAARWLSIKIKWVGYRASIDQALSWPRNNACTQDYKYIDGDEIPNEVKNAQSELAQSFIESNRTDDYDDYGIKSVAVDTIRVEFDKLDRKPFIAKQVIDMLDGLGVILGSGSIKVYRN